MRAEKDCKSGSMKYSKLVKSVISPIVAEKMWKITRKC